MQQPAMLLSPDLTVEQAWKLLAAEPAPRYLVGADRHVVGTLDFNDLETARAKGHGEQTLWTVVDHEFVHAHPDQPIDVVVDRLAQSGGVLPVVSRTDAYQLEGVVTQDGLLGHSTHRLPNDTQPAVGGR